MNLIAKNYSKANRASTLSTSKVIGFIVGTSRGGTTWLTACLNSHPDIMAFGETSFFGKKFKAPLNGSTYSQSECKNIIKKIIKESGAIHNLHGMGEFKNIDLKNYGKIIASAFSKSDLSFTPNQLFEYYCQALAIAEGKKFIIEKTPHHINWLHRISKYFPHAKFIIIMRDAWGFMNSYKHQSYQDSYGKKLGKEKNYHPLGAAIVWRKYAFAALEAIQYYSDRCLLIGYDEIANESTMVLKTVQDFLGVRIAKIDQKKMNSSFEAGSKGYLGAEDIFWMRLIAGRALTAFSNPKIKLSSNVLSIVWSILILPVWSIRAFSDVVKFTGIQSIISYLWRWLVIEK